jgi:Mg-chelatase subunit ChlD
MGNSNPVNRGQRLNSTTIVLGTSAGVVICIQDFTADKALLLDGLYNLYVEGGQTAVLDGVYLAAEHVAEYKKGDENDRRRRALIVITDGEDRNSFYKQGALSHAYERKMSRFLSSDLSKSLIVTAVLSGRARVKRP